MNTQKKYKTPDFYSYLINQDAEVIRKMTTNLGIILKRKTVETSINSKWLSAAEVCQLIKGTTNIRDRILLIVIFSLGLRVSEAIGIKWTDFKNDKVTIRGKGNTTRVLTVPPDIPLLLDALPHEHEYVFTNNMNHNPLLRGAVHYYGQSGG